MAAPPDRIERALDGLRFAGAGGARNQQVQGFELAREGHPADPQPVLIERQALP